MSYGRIPNRILGHEGRGGGIRTPDILLPKQARYQTALHPVFNELYAGAPHCEVDSAGVGGGDSSRFAGASRSAFLDRRTRPLSSASSTFTFTIWPSFR